MEVPIGNIVPVEVGVEVAPMVQEDREGQVVSGVLAVGTAAAGQVEAQP